MRLDQYQTVKEVAEATVRGWIHEGSLSAIDVGKSC
jgi:hypothetical protein